MVLLTNVFGNLSQLFWISAQLPQVWENYKNKSVEGLSLPFLLSWLCGDITNLIGCLFTNQLTFQRNLAIYFNLIDLVLIGQFILYSKPPSSSALEPGSTEINPVGFLTEPPTVLHSSLNLERNSINKLGSDLSSNRINHSISDETSKSSCPLLHSRIRPSHPFSPRNPTHNSDGNLGLNTYSSTPTPTTHSRPVQAIRSCSLKIIIFLAILGFTLFEVTPTKKLFSSTHAHHSTNLQTPSFSSQTTTIDDGLNSIINGSDDPHHPILPSLDFQSSNIPYRTKETPGSGSHLKTNTNKTEKKKNGTISQRIGRISAWLCALLYLTSRIPQIYKNYSRKSVEGLSILLFILAFLGNLTYVSSILTSTKILGKNGAKHEEHKLRYLNESIPYLIGSAGTLCFDFTIFIQSWIYRKQPVTSSNSYRRLSNASDPSESSSSDSIMNL